MARIAIGVILLTGGLFTLVLVQDIGIIWTGGIIVGILLIVQGISRMSHKQHVSREVDSIRRNWDDLTSRLMQGQSLDHIAGEYYRQDRIPPIRTIQVAAYLIKSLAESRNQDAQKLAAAFASVQDVDSVESAASLISRFSFHDHVYSVDDTAMGFRTHPEENGGTTGTLILTKGYLYFFAKPKNLRALLGDPAVSAEVAKAQIPFLSIAASGYGLVSGLSRELADYFDGSRISELQERFSHEASCALPLAEISQLECVTRKWWKAPSVCLEVRGVSSASNEEWAYWFGTSSTDVEKWMHGWIDRLQIACIAEGRLLGRV